MQRVPVDAGRAIVRALRSRFALTLVYVGTLLGVSGPSLVYAAEADEPVTEVVVTQLRLLSGNGSGNGNGNSERREAPEDQSRGANTKAQELENPLDDSVPF